MNDATWRGLARGLLISAGLVVAGGLGWAVYRPTAPADPAATYAAAVGGPFTLTDVNGRPFGSDRLRGKPFAIFFGFTRCPDVCPTTLSRMARLRAQLGADGDRFSIVFVSVDPESDTPEQIGRYLTLFDTPIIGLTGTPQQLDAVKRAYAVYARRVPLEGGGYTMDHTASVFLMGRGNEFVTTLDAHEDEATSLAKLRRLIRG
jgi:protein SCO1/2